MTALENNIPQPPCFLRVLGSDVPLEDLPKLPTPPGDFEQKIVNMGQEILNSSPFLQDMVANAKEFDGYAFKQIDPETAEGVLVVKVNKKIVANLGIVQGKIQECLETGDLKGLLSDRELLKQCDYLQIPVFGIVLSSATPEEFQELLDVFNSQLDQVEIDNLYAIEDSEYDCPLTKQGLASLITPEQLISALSTATLNPNDLQLFLTIFGTPLVEPSEGLEPQSLIDSVKNEIPTDVLHAAYTCSLSNIQDCMGLFARCFKGEFSRLKPLINSHRLSSSFRNFTINKNTAELTQFLEVHGSEGLDVLDQIDIETLYHVLFENGNHPANIEHLLTAFESRLNQITPFQLQQLIASGIRDPNALRTILNYFGPDGANLLSTIEADDILYRMRSSFASSEGISLLLSAFRTQLSEISIQDTSTLLADAVVNPDSFEALLDFFGPDGLDQLNSIEVGQGPLAWHRLPRSPRAIELLNLKFPAQMDQMEPSFLAQWMRCLLDPELLNLDEEDEVPGAKMFVRLFGPSGKNKLVGVSYEDIEELSQLAGGNIEALNLLEKAFEGNPNW